MCIYIYIYIRNSKAFQQDAADVHDVPEDAARDLDYSIVKYSKVFYFLFVYLFYLFIV